VDYFSLDRIFAYDPDTGAITRRANGMRADRVYSGMRGYAVVSVSGKNFRAHRLAWLLMTGKQPPAAIDHVNRVRSDNRWANLRESTPLLNQQNRRDVSNKHGHPGVAWFPQNKKFGARIRLNGKRLYVGMFDTIEEAADAYQQARRAMFKGRYEETPSLSRQETRA
jgi:hypothetical protein